MLQFKQVHIPHVGTLELVPHASRFDVVDHLMHPPAFSVQLKDKFSGSPKHQLEYLAAYGSMNRSQIEGELDQIGREIRKRIEREPFSWNGIGTLEASGNGVQILDSGFLLNGFEAVPAHKVLRDNTRHSMRVGDQEMSAQQVGETLREKRRRRVSLTTLGWVLLVIGIAAIVAMIIMNGGSPLSSGLRTRAI